MSNLSITTKVSNFFSQHKGVFAICAATLILLANGAFLSVRNSRYFENSSSFLLGITVISALLMVALYVLWRVLKAKKVKRSSLKVFMTGFCILGLLYCVVFTPLTVPDEEFHYKSAYKYSDVIMGKTYDDTTMEMRADDHNVLATFTVSVKAKNYESLKNDFSIFARDDSIVTVNASKGLIDSNPVQTRIFSAIGISLGRLLGLSGILTFYLGRLFNLLMFALLLWGAIRITPVAKKAFMAIALLPMTLHLASSYSYDVTVTGLTFLLTALCLHAIYGKDKIKKWEIAGIAITAFFLAPCKALYVLVAGLVFLIPNKRFKNTAWAMGFKFGVCLLAAFSMFLVQFAHIVSLTGASAASSGGPAPLDTRGTETGHFHKAGEFFTDPINTLFIYLNTGLSMSDWYLNTTVGGSLGWFQGTIASPWALVVPFIVIALVSSLKAPDDEVVPSVGFRFMSFIIIALGSFLVLTSMLFGHTFTTEDVIMGAQGRYFIPFIPLLLFAIRGTAIECKKNIDLPLVLTAVFFNLFYLTLIFSKAIVL